MASPSLGIVDVTSGQSDKEITINTALAKLENATQRFLAVDATAGNVTLTNTEYTTNFFFRVSGHAAVRDLVVPLELTASVDAPRLFMVHNEGTVDGVLTVKGASGTTVVLPIGEKALIYSDGVNLELIHQEGPNARPIDIGFNFLGLMTDGALLAQYVVATPFTLPVSLTGSQGFALVAPTDADVDIDIQKNGSSIGTLTFADTTGTFSAAFASAVSFAAGDRLSLVAPVTADTVGESFSITLHGTRN